MKFNSTPTPAYSPAYSPPSSSSPSPSQNPHNSPHPPDSSLIQSQSLHDQLSPIPTKQPTISQSPQQTHIYPCRDSVVLTFASLLLANSGIHFPFPCVLTLCSTWSLLAWYSLSMSSLSVDTTPLLGATLLECVFGGLERTCIALLQRGSSWCTMEEGGGGTRKSSATDRSNKCSGRS